MANGHLFEVLGVDSEGRGVYHSTEERGAEAADDLRGLVAESGGQDGRDLILGCFTIFRF